MGLLSSLVTDQRILLLLVLTVLAAGLTVMSGLSVPAAPDANTIPVVSDYIRGLKFGIDFSGGTRIPVVLDHAVDTESMDEMVQTLKVRAASLGLTEVKVRARGTSEIIVELPNSDPKLVDQVERILSQQGVYQGVVDGKLAIRGDDLFTGTITRTPSQYLQGADWGVSFSVTQTGAERFASVAKGKANYPLFMFLDRPSDSIVLISRADLLANVSQERFPLSDEEALALARDALRLEGDEVPVYILDDFDSYSANLTPFDNKTRAVLSQDAPQNVKDTLTAKGYTRREKAPADMVPQYSLGGGAGAVNSVNEWPAVGLMSAPRLVEGVTEGVPSFGYQITGPAPAMAGRSRTASADFEAKRVSGILKGGALPVQISLGSRTSVPAPLGAEFLRLSLIGAVMALAAISLLIAVRYRSLKIILPIVFVSISEIIILVSILGYFTIDLGGMAGIIAAIGISVDSQIVITDELLKRHKAGERLSHEEAQKKLDKAFSIVVTTVTVAVVAMLPLLLFSGLVEVIGFATSTILGSLLGVFISRPAYGAVVERLILE